MAKLKIGVFGAGRGQTMVNQLLHNDEAELVAVCDKHEPSLEQCKKAAEDCGQKIAAYTNFDDFFNHDMDAVVLANYAYQHAPYAIKFLNSGRHVMSEVLTCATMKEAVELIEAVERTGKVYNYAENYCFFNTTYEMKTRYQRGDIGELMYAEGEYVHDCSKWWPGLTYGERNHWRNQCASTFYCTHSLGPIVYSSGLRPVSVVGYQTQSPEYMRAVGAVFASGGIEMVTLENGAVVKSIHGNLRREPSSINYEMYGTTGMMETDRWDLSTLHLYQQTGGNCVGEHTSYKPEFVMNCDTAAGHGGSDFFTTYYWIRQILGDEEMAKRTIGVYQAVDMCIPGLLAYRSIVNNNACMKVPNLRNKAEREVYRNDTFCTFRDTAGDQYVSSDPKAETEPIPDSVYDEMRRKWLNDENA